MTRVSHCPVQIIDVQELFPVSVQVPAAAAPLCDVKKMRCPHLPADQTQKRSFVSPKNISDKMSTSPVPIITRITPSEGGRRVIASYA